MNECPREQPSNKSSIFFPTSQNHLLTHLISPRLTSNLTYLSSKCDTVSYRWILRNASSAKISKFDSFLLSSPGLLPLCINIPPWFVAIKLPPPPRYLISIISLREEFCKHYWCETTLSPSLHPYLFDTVQVLESAQCCPMDDYLYQTFPLTTQRKILWCCNQSLLFFLKKKKDAFSAVLT